MPVKIIPQYGTKYILLNNPDGSFRPYKEVAAEIAALPEGSGFDFREMSYMYSYNVEVSVQEQIEGVNNNIRQYQKYIDNYNKYIADYTPRIAKLKLELEVLLKEQGEINEC